MRYIKYLGIASFIFFLFSCESNSGKKDIDVLQETQKPNIVIIYTDDLGYGDVGFNGATEIKTPNLDKIANGGVRFTNGFASSSTCTPSRYALLTGIYPWRGKDVRVLPGTAPLIIAEDQMTIPRMLKTKGYHTGIIGKWHLGLGTGKVDWNKKIKPSPNEVGFDYSYIMAATQDRVPTVYIKNGNVVGLDPKDPIEINYKKGFPDQVTGLDNPELTTMKWHHGHNGSIVNGISRIGHMKGGEKAKWVDVDMADHFLKGAQDYVRKHKDETFFLYYAMQQPHVPRTPHPRFVGKSGLGPRGDVILEADWCIGEFMKTLDAEGLLENTLIVFSSDNGPVLNDGYYDDAEEKLGAHTPAGGLRGGKYSLFEAGTHVPFFTYWKGTIQPKVSDAMICQLDLLSSLSKLVGSDIRAKDSEELLDALIGKSEKGRDNLVIEAVTKTAFKEGNWVMIPPYNGAPVKKNIELGIAPEYQLYNLKEDVGQNKNLAKVNKEKLETMISKFKEIRGNHIVKKVKKKKKK